MDRKRIAQELLLAAKDVAEAERMMARGLFVTAEEMERYCPDCAAKIRNGSMKVPRADFKRVVAGLAARRIER